MQDPELIETAAKSAAQKICQGQYQNYLFWNAYNNAYAEAKANTMNIFTTAQRNLLNDLLQQEKKQLNNAHESITNNEKIITSLEIEIVQKKNEINAYRHSNFLKNTLLFLGASFIIVRETTHRYPNFFDNISKNINFNFISTFFTKR